MTTPQELRNYAIGSWEGGVAPAAPIVKALDEAADKIEQLWKALLLTNAVVESFANGQPVSKDMLRRANEAMAQCLATSQ